MQGVILGGRDGCRPYSFDRQCGVPCSPATFFDGEEKRTCIRRCQNIYYQNKYEDDKHFGGQFKFSVSYKAYRIIFPLLEFFKNLSTLATMAYSMYPRSMTVSVDGKERAKVPTIIGHLNETQSTPMNLTEVWNLWNDIWKLWNLDQKYFDEGIVFVWTNHYGFPGYWRIFALCIRYVSGNSYQLREKLVFW